MDTTQILVTVVSSFLDHKNKLWFRGELPSGLQVSFTARVGPLIGEKVYIEYNVKEGNLVKI